MRRQGVIRRRLIEPHENGHPAGRLVVARRDRDDLGVRGVGFPAKAALAAAQRTGLLILPATDQVIPGLVDALALLRRARAEGWRLLLLDSGVDSAAASAVECERLLERLIAAGDPDPGLPLPPAPLRRRIGGTGEEHFRRSGLLHVECFETTLAAVGVQLSEVGDLLEWGAGCGRMTVHLPGRAPQARITAVDTDAEAIAWVASNLSVQRAEAIEIDPPTTLDDDEFELVIGHSVFSHLDIESQERWLAELARVTRPGGHVAVSYNGPAALRWHVEHPLVELPESVAHALERDGIAVWRGDGWENEFYDGYHTTFHQHAYVREHWSQFFEVVSIDEAAALPTQDIVVLRARRR